MELNIGKNIKRKREEYDLEQKELAHRADTTPMMISYIERDIKKPSVELLVRIAEVLHCTVNDLVYDKSA